MGANRPSQAGKLFEERFAASDLDGLMDLYEDGAVFTNARDGSWKFIIDNPDGPALISHD